MTHGSLFTGIGGFDLAAQWAGFQNVFQCEINPFCQTVLKYHFPDCELFSDIKTTDFTKYYGTIDIISGGFPCQPFSVAGKRQGTDDDRWLWEEMYRAICEVSPRWVVAENVSGLLTQQRGVVFEQVLSDLENAGYEVQPFVIPACAVNAPHRRDRVWIIANAEIKRSDSRRGNCNRKIQNTPKRTDVSFEINRFSKERLAANAKSAGLQSSKNRQAQGQFGGSVPKWDEFTTQSPVCNRDDGFPFKLANITFPTWRRKSIEALGNAIVVQVAYEIFKKIKEI